MSAELFHVKREGSINVLELTLPQSIDTKEFEHLNQALARTVRCPGF